MYILVPMQLPMLWVRLVCDMNPFYESVYSIVEKIPYGKVMSYGQIAKMAGKPRSAREVGRAMKHCPEHLPWQRVIMSDGKVTGGAYAEIRKAALLDEGVSLLPDGRVDMKKHQWFE